MRQTARTERSRRRLFPCCTVLDYSVRIFTLGFLLFVALRLFSLSEQQQAPKICVDLNRHRVRGKLPAKPGGADASEPFAVGYVRIDKLQSLIGWELEDGLHFVPSALAIHGPLHAPDLETAEVFVPLTVDRDSRGRLRGILDVAQEKVDQILARPSLFYVAVRSELTDQEVVRDTLDKRC